jgi:hypothetical protein
VSPRPDEFGFALREDEFQILCEGDSSEARGWRDLCIGAFVTALIAVVPLDIDPIQHPISLVKSMALVAIAAGSGVGAIIWNRILTRTRTNSAHSRLKKRISDHFSGHPTQTQNR